MLNWPAKDPDATLDFAWVPPLDDGDTLASASVSCVQGDVVIDGQTLGDTQLTVILSGGSIGINLFRGVWASVGGRLGDEFIQLRVSEGGFGDEPLTLVELKRHADIVRDDIDGTLASLITAGREWVETYTGLTVYADRVVQRFDRFYSPMSLVVAPADNSPTVSYIDANGDPAELMGARVITTSRPARLLAPVGAMWPSVASDVTVTIPGVPDTFKAAIALYVRAIHEDGAISPAYQNALEALCRPYRMMVIG